MTRPHVMTLIPRTIPETKRPGVYSIPYTFVMPGDWNAEFEVTGPKVVTAKADLDVPIAVTAPPPTTTNTPVALPTRLETSISERDWVSMAVLWVHGLASLGWIVGVIVMAIALSVPPLLTEGARAGISRWYRSWGAWAHWSAVPLIVATGIYNMVYVTPFELAVTPSAIDDLSNIAYGRTYEAILLFKLALFVVLLVTGTMVLMRTIRPQAVAEPGAGAGADAHHGPGASGGRLPADRAPDPRSGHGSAVRAHPQPRRRGRKYLAATLGADRSLSRAWCFLRRLGLRSLVVLGGAVTLTKEAKLEIIGKHGRTRRTRARRRFRSRC